MGTFGAILARYFKSCESCDYGNQSIDLPFQSSNVPEFHIPLLLDHFATCTLSYINLVGEVRVACTFPSL